MSIENLKSIADNMISQGKITKEIMIEIMKTEKDKRMLYLVLNYIREKLFKEV
jgi:hypothetical protein